MSNPSKKPRLEHLLRKAFVFTTMASLLIVVHMQLRVKPILDVTAFYVLLLPHPSLGTLPTTIILVLPVLPILVFLLPTLQ
jgi:hypothetical protein